MTNPFKGLVGLSQSRKFWFTQIIFWPTVWLTHGGHIADTAFLAVVGSLTSVFLAAHTATDIFAAKILGQNTQPSYDPNANKQP